MADYKKCQVFTPHTLGEKMLSLCDYTSDPINRSFLECSCGDGALLRIAVRHYIETAKQQKIKPSQIKRGLERNFLGIEIEQEKVDLCIKNLDFVSNSYGIKNVHWNILCGDYLAMKLSRSFDYIVGNPPYVSYLNMSSQLRDYLKKNFQSCQHGKFDYCFPFIERSLPYLKKGGKLCFVTPEAIFKTDSGAALRDMLLKDIFLLDMSLPNKVFPGILVSAVIFVVKSGFSSSNLSIIKPDGNAVTVDKEILKGKRKWSFLHERNSNESQGLSSFGDCFDVFTSIATLANSVFIVENGRLNDDYLETRTGYQIERDLVRKAILPRLSRLGKQAYLIYPYKRNGERIDLEELKNIYPMAYQYFSSMKDTLTNRDSDSCAAFFEFGRYQSVKKMSGEKYCLSSIITDSPSLWYCDEESIPCSGIVIKEKSKMRSLSDVPKILKSARFLDYVKRVGIQCAGSSYRISVKDLRSFRF